MSRDFYAIIDQICEEDGRYALDAYEFMMEALAYTQKKFKRSKHVTGTELLEGIKQLLVDQFGPLTLTVLEHWGITTTEDFGNVVFNLVQKQVLSKDEKDNIDSFRDVFDFQEVFQLGYRKQLEKRISRMRSA